MKATKHGFKAFLLCEASTGYCLKHTFFSGPNQEIFRPINICNDLASGYENRYFHIYADNYYISIPLLRSLSTKGFYFTGTVRRDSKGLPNLNTIIENNHGFKQLFFQKDNIFLCLYKDKRIVKMLSNYFSSEVTEKKGVQLPLIVAKYTNNMGGVDLFDQKVAYYHYPHRFAKWWKFLFGYLLEIAINNAFIIFLIYMN